MRHSEFIPLAIILILSLVPISDAQPVVASYSERPILDELDKIEVNPPLQSVFPSENFAKNYSVIGTVSPAYSTQVQLSYAILVFALLLSILMGYIVTKKGIAWDPMSVIRIFGLTFVITTGMYLITAGYSSERIAPMLSLLASIAGYLLGESKGRNEQKTDTSKE